MEQHSSHAQPLPVDKPHDSAMTSWSTNQAVHDSPLDSPSHQVRRLQLRHVGFRAAALPTRRISPLFGASPVGIDPFMRPSNKENTPYNSNNRAGAYQTEATAAGNILQVVQDSARKRTLSKPNFRGVSAILYEEPGETSWYNEASNKSSPYESNYALNVPKRREVSQHQRSLSQLSPPTSLCGRHGAVHTKTRSPSADASSYTEFLGGELAFAKSSLDSDLSPEGTKKRNARLRALSTENRNLRHEMESWQKKYHDVVQEEADKRLGLEAEMKDHLDTIESEIELKDARIRELEWEYDSVKTEVRDVESLRGLNEDLERRIDVLTKMLAQSPVTDAQSALTSPTIPIPSKSVPRQRPTLPKIPRSPHSNRFSLAAISEAARWQQISLDMTPQMHDFTGWCGETVTSPESSEEARSPTRMSQQMRPVFPRASASMYSTPSPTSRPTSFAPPCYTTGPWDPPVLADDDEMRAAGRKRRMRRFAPGTKSLKPLVLPTTNSRQSLPASAPILPTFESQKDLHRHTTFDPAFLLMSGLQTKSTTSTPKQQVQRQSTSEAHDQALLALEGKSLRSDESDKDLDARISSPSGTLVHSSESDEQLDTTRHQPLSSRSLESELEGAEFEDARSSVQSSTLKESLEGAAAVKEIEVAPEQLVIGLEPPSPEESISDLTKRDSLPTKTTMVLEPGLPSKLKDCHGAYVTRAAYPRHNGLSMLLRSIGLIYETDEYSTLVRRILSNAWSLGSNTLLGGLCWWLLGPVYHWLRQSVDMCHDLVVPSKVSQNEEGTQVRLKDHHQSTRSSILGTERSLEITTYGRQEEPQFLSLTTTSKPDHRAATLECSDCVEPSSRRTLRLWFRFSVTIILAIGMAIKHGPGVLLSDTLGVNAAFGKGDVLETSDILDESRDTLDTSGEKSSERDCSARTSKTDSSKADSGYDSIRFPASLAPKDSEEKL